MTSLSVEAKQRARAAILGGLVADAATMPLHWIYDVPKINTLLAEAGRTATPEFFPTPSCSFYTHKFGENSPYGFELVPLLESLASKGSFDAEDYSRAIHEYFTANSFYRNHSTKAVVEKYEAGKRGLECGHDKDYQANCFAKAPLLVARYGGQPDFLARTEAAIRVQQNNDEAVAYGLAAAMILEKVVCEGWTAVAALEWAGKQGGVHADVQKQIALALSTRTEALTELQYTPVEYMAEMVGKHVAIKDSLPAFTWAVWCNGPACGNPAAFANVAMAGTQFSSYVEGVRANLMAGGDNCSRACLLGALLAAQGGMESIPQGWRDQTTGYKEYEALVDKLLA